MRNTKRNLLAGLIMALVCAVIGLRSGANAQAQKSPPAVSSVAALQQPSYTEYKGVHLGMTTEEARAKLGTPAMKASDQDFYVLSESETAQVVYDAMHKVVTISVDYAGGIGAPDYKAVVGGELERTADGSLYRIVRYESLGFWVSYNRTGGPVIIVTITIQKMQR